jgi:hypothetical protein
VSEGVRDNPRALRETEKVADNVADSLPDSDSVIVVPDVSVAECVPRDKEILVLVLTRDMVKGVKL